LANATYFCFNSARVALGDAPNISYNVGFLLPPGDGIVMVGDDDDDDDCCCCRSVKGEASSEEMEARWHVAELTLYGRSGMTV
jgi:hypothetical protein